MSDKQDLPKELLNFQRAREYKRSWIKEAEEDYRFLVGDQWEQPTIDKLIQKGVLPLTFNKIQALIFLIAGIQRQNRSDIKAYPEGEEDSLTAEIITILLKNLMKTCEGEYKISEMFEDGIVCGEGWIEPFIDYTWDLVMGQMKFAKKCPFYVFADPASKEYLKDDGEFIVVYQPNLSKDQVVSIFPTKEKEIEAINNTKMNFNDESKKVIPQINDNYGATAVETDSTQEKDYDLTRYHYYKYENVYYVVDPDDIKASQEQISNKKDAEELAKIKNSRYGKEVVKVLPRKIPIPYVKSFIGDTEIDDEKSPFYPRYKKIPIFGFFAHTVYAPLKKTEYLTQGIVRSLKDPQKEINKRRTNELHILNSSTNSGWLNKKRGGFSNKEEVRKYGSSPGIILDYDTEKPEQIFPKPLSTGHEKLVQLANQDIKEISGINTDLLAMNDKASSSGRAIHLRQQQGLMMIQRILDNFRRTKQELGRFLLTQIGEVYDVEKAVRVCGDTFIKNHFSVPILQNGQPTLGPDGNIAMEIDEEAVKQVFGYILNDMQIATYDVAVGEIASAETIKLANYSMLMDLVEKGVPIPPDVIIDESLIASESKQKIKKAIAAMQQASAKAQPAQQRR